MTKVSTKITTKVDGKQLNGRLQSINSRKLRVGIQYDFTYKIINMLILIGNCTTIAQSNVFEHVSTGISILSRNYTKEMFCSF